MKILLAKPRSRLEVKRTKRILKDPPSLGLEVVKAVTPSRHEVKIINEREENINFDEHYDLVGFTSLTSTVNRVYENAAKFKENGIPTVIGGIHASVLPQEALAKGIDYVIVGRAEDSWPQFLDKFERSNGNLGKKIYRADRILKKWVAPVYEKGLKSIARQFWEKQPIKNQIMFGNGGCPYRCKFCSVYEAYGSDFWLPPFKEAIKTIKNISSPIFITNDNLFGNRRFKNWTDQFLTQLTSLEKKKTWVTQVSLDALTEKLVKKLAKAGCKAIYTGLESLNEVNLIEMRKKHNLPRDGRTVEEHAAEKIKTCQDHGIMTIISTIIGFDEDNNKWLEKTLDFYKKTEISVPQVYILTPLPGTDLRKEMLAQGKKLATNWDLYDCLHPTFSTKNFSETQLQEWIDTFYRELYSKSAVFKHLGKLIKTPSFQNILSLGINFGYNRFSKIRDANQEQLEEIIALDKVRIFVNKYKSYGEKIKYEVYPRLRYWIVDSSNRLVKEIFPKKRILKMLDRFNLYLKRETGFEPEFT